MLAFALTIFLSAFLLFQIQPLIGKAVLPWFGGAPSVWTTCMLFFQLLLLGGYAYAHGVASRLSPRAQKRLHVGLLLAAAGGLAAAALVWGSPVLPPPGLKPADPQHPVLRILAVLSVSVGLPYFLLATTGPLLQAWFARVYPGASPYRLYALSNVGSLLGLATYPFLVEPRLALHAQGGVWAAGFAVFAACCGLCAARFASSSLRQEPSIAREKTEGEQPRPTARARLLWFALAACASAVLLGATNQICQEVASFPFLWVLPLSLYLLSFILCFEREGFYRRGIFGPALVIGVGLSALVLSQGFLVSLPRQVAAHTFALFAVCMVCHGELARAKPGPRHLTAFYLMLSAGGAFGGLLVAIVAPRVFSGFWEYHLTLWVSGVLALIVLALDPASWLRSGRPWPALVTLVGALALAAAVRRREAFETVVSFLFRDPFTSLRKAALAVGALLVAAAVLGAARPFWWRPARPLFAAGCLVLSLALVATVLLSDVQDFRHGAVLLTRNFYGVLTVEEENKEFPEMHLLKLRNGRIVHGFQYQSPNKRDEPTSYYSPKSGIGLAILKHPHRDLGMRIGVVGLGVGTVAAFARLGDAVRFYDINPEVVRLSLGEHRVFTYLADCMGKVEVVQGDARLSLERELAERRPQGFDVLAIDAFSSDSIPVHLLTREAVEVYIAHLSKPDGILAIHISNRYLELKPVVRGLADALGCDVSLVDVSDDGQYWGSTWVLLAPRGDVLSRSGIDDDAEELPADKIVRVWTDDYSNLFQVVKR